MVTRFLITTALESTWRDDVPVLFLGEWCRLHSRRHKWQALDAEVLPYHWDDRDRLRADYYYLRDLYERLLSHLTVDLNRIHGVKHSARYWRILVGPWLGYFTQMMFDRWTSVQQAVRDYAICETAILKNDAVDELVPFDMAHFTKLALTDEWNHWIYAAILQRFTGVRCLTLAKCGKKYSSNSAHASSLKRRLKEGVASAYSSLASKFKQDDDAFFIATYLPAVDEMRLHTRFRQVPQLWRPVSPGHVPLDVGARQWSVSGYSACRFESCVRSLIPAGIPRAYLEGYNELVARTRHLPWPRHPKVIFTSNAYSSDDVFKAWAAEQVQKGTPLAIGQHGGGHGTHLWAFYEEHQLAICDAFFSWGWTDGSEPKVTPVGQLKSKRPSRVRRPFRRRLLLITTTLPRQTYHLFSGVVARQWLDYFEDQCTFVTTLRPEIQNLVTVRLYLQDYGWDQSDRWSDRFPDIKVDPGRSKIDEVIAGSRLCISTYNATTFLESFAMNIPTVVFWNPRHWELRDSAKPYFETLQRVGIFHETPESAARHVNRIWPDVEAWWSSTDVQEVLARFKQHYCYLPHDVVMQVQCALENVIRGSNVTVAK